MFEGLLIKVAFLITDLINFGFCFVGTVLYIECEPLNINAIKHLVTQTFIIPAFAVFFGTIIVLMRMFGFILLFFVLPSDVNYGVANSDEQND